METIEHLIAGQYELTQLLADTSLGRLFRARDLMQTPLNNSISQNVLMLAIIPALSEHPQFASTLSQVLEQFAKPDSLLPVIDACQSSGIYWIVYPDQPGELLISRIIKFDQKQVPIISQIQTILLNILRSSKALLPKDALGFLEPSAILCHGNHYKILTAPVIITWRLLNKTNSNASLSKIVFDSPYLSPAVAQGNNPTPQDDTFSLASIAYYCLTGSYAYGSLSTIQALVQKAKPIALSQLKPELWTSLERGLSLYPFSRPSPYELLHAFTAAPEIDEALEPENKSTGRKWPLTVAITCLSLFSVYVAYQSNFSSSEAKLKIESFAVTKTTSSISNPTPSLAITHSPNTSALNSNSSPLVKSELTQQTTNPTFNNHSLSVNLTKQYTNSSALSSDNSVIKLTKFNKLSEHKLTDNNSSKAESKFPKNESASGSDKAPQIRNRSKIKLSPVESELAAKPMNVETISDAAATHREIVPHQPVAQNPRAITYYSAKPAIAEPVKVVRESAPTVAVKPVGSNRFIVTRSPNNFTPTSRKQILVQTDSNTFVVATE